MTLIKLTQWDKEGKQIPIYINADRIDWMEPHSTRLKATIHFGGSILNVIETVEEIKEKINKFQYWPWCPMPKLENDPGEIRPFPDIEKK